MGLGWGKLYVTIVRRPCLQRPCPCLTTAGTKSWQIQFTKSIGVIYHKCLICFTCLVALFCTFSMASISLTLYGDHVVTPYSKCGLTNAL